jgi:pSer/pThr/pTyr-binding forkhead associated (FHA) protein
MVLEYACGVSREVAMAKLLVHEETGIREFELVGEDVQIGRELDNTLRLHDPSVSRHHAVLKRVPEGYLIQDKNSSNGVYVNDEKVEETALKDGDQITLGQLHIFFQETDRSPTATEATEDNNPNHKEST